MKAGRLHDPLGDHHASAAYRSDECANRRFAKGVDARTVSVAAPRS